MSTPGHFWKTLLLAMAVGLSVFEIWSVLFSAMDPLLQRSIFLSWLLALGFLAHRPYHSGFLEGPSALDIVKATVALAGGVYYAWQFDRILYRWAMIDPLTAWDLFIGTAIFLLLLDTTRRAVGWPIVIIAVLFSLYVLAGHWLPGMFSHRYLSFGEFIDQMIYTINGVYGSPLAVAATYVYMFILFGVVLYHSGGGEFFINVAKLLAGKTRGGPAKVAVVSSALFGMISGSPVSDTVTTGTFTIPLMRRMGYKAVEAGAIVAVAATGGGIMPPVMGSAAFLMTEFTGIEYVRIAIAASLPALLYYLGIMAQVHFLALKHNIQTLQDEPSPRLKSLLTQNFQYIAPILGLTILLLRGNTPTQAAGFATLLTVLVSWRHRETRMGLKKILAALEDTARAALVVTAATASAGILVGAIVSTGAGGKFTSVLFDLSSDHLFPALLITMVVCAILGMGMPVPSAYILTAVVAAPALIHLGVPAMQAHLFIVYFATMSAITPPVAVAAFAAAGLTGANPNAIGYRAMRLGIVAFIVPYIFVYNPELLLRGSFLAVSIAFVTSMVGVIALAASLEGWLLTRAAAWERVGLVIAGLMMMVPGFRTDLIGLVILCIVLTNQWRQRARAVQPAMLTPSESPGLEPKP